MELEHARLRAIAEAAYLGEPRPPDHPPFALPLALPSPSGPRCDSAAPQPAPPAPLPSAQPGELTLAREPRSPPP
eukprot:3158851-Pleurochrysis_carterae.AAC.1